MVLPTPKIRLFLTAVFLVIPLALQAQSFVASVDRQSVYQGEQVEYTLELQGSSRAKNPQFPTFEGFRILSGPNESSNFQIINGKMSSSITYTWRLLAQKAGTLTIGQATAKVGRQTISSNKVMVNVLDRGASLPEGAEPPDVMVKAEVSKKEVYANEPVHLTYKLYFRKNLSNYEVSKLPNTVGFWSEDVPIPDQPRLTDQTIQGYRYGVIVVRRATLFPTNPGDLTLDPLEVTCMVQEQAQTTRRRSRSMFDSFFDDPFFQPRQVVTKSVATDPIHLKVKPLPTENQPKSFAGDVGQYRMDVKLDPTEVTVNEAITLKISISGQGNIRLINEPKFDIPLDIERYDPKITHSISNKTNVIKGSKTFEYLLIPRVPGQQRIPPIEFAYFDPGQGQYRTSRSGPLTIDVKKGTGFASSAARTLSREDVQWRGQDIRYIKLTTGSFQHIGDVFHHSARFYGLLLAPVVLFGLGFMYRRQKDRLDQNVSRARRLHAYTNGLKKWKVAAKSIKQKPEIFYGNISKVLGGYIADVLNIPEATGGTEEALEALGEKGVADEIMKEIREIFNASDFARFASGEDSPQEREQLLRRTRTIIQRLERELKV